MVGRWGRRRLCMCALVVWSIGAHVRAQVGSGALMGTVSNQAGASISGATVTVTETATTITRSVVTAADGAYAIPGLRPGSYALRFELGGFQPLTRDGIQIATGDTVRLDVQLEIGGVNEAITVSADASLLRSATLGLGQVIDNRKVRALPLNGRSFITLVALAPGVALPPGSSVPRINGGRPRTNEYLFDGISVLQPEPGRWRSFRISTPFRSSRSTATARRPNSAVSMAAS